MQENNMYEREIDLVQLIKYLWKRVWIMCIGAGIGLILLLGLQLVRQGEQEVSEDSSKITGFAKEMKEYEEDYAQLEMEIANLEKSIEEQISYNNNSILMKINPYDKKSVSGQFYIDSDYQIMPELTYQNADITASVIKAYQALATTGELAKYVNGRIEEPIKERYLNELITISSGGENGVNGTGNAVLNVTVVHTDIDSARKIYDLVLECMNSKREDFQKKIGKYTITLLNESESASVDTALKETQVSNIDTINTLKETLNKKQESFDSLVMPTQGMSLKLLIVGAFLGGFCVAAVFVVLFLVDTSLKTEEDVTRRLQLSVLGNIPVENGKEKLVKREKRGRKARYTQYRGSK